MSPGTPDSPHYLTNYTFHSRGKNKIKMELQEKRQCSYGAECIIWQFCTNPSIWSQVPPANTSCWPMVGSCVQRITDKLPLARCRGQLWGPGTSSDVAHHAVLPGHMPSVCQAMGRRGTQNRYHHTLQKGYSYSVSFVSSHIIWPAGFGHREACLPAPNTG